MKKTFYTCAEHRNLRFKSEGELKNHILNEHDSDIFDYLESNYYDEAVDDILGNLSETIEIDLDELPEEEEPKIDYDKIRMDIAKGKQKTLVMEK